MKRLLLISLGAISLYGLNVHAQGQTALESRVAPPEPTASIQNYFTDESKVKVVEHMQKVILAGCTVPVKTMPRLEEDEFDYYVKQTKQILEERFSKSFSENPLIKTMLFKSLDEIQSDKSCYKSGNDCRERLLANAAYYYQKLRPNVPGCEVYSKKKPDEKGYEKKCEAELGLRNRVLTHSGNSNGGMDQMGVYTDTMVRELNRVAKDLSLLILHRNKEIKYEHLKVYEDGEKVKVDRLSKVKKDSQKVDICEDVQSGVGYSFNLLSNVNVEPFGGFDPSKKGVQTPGTPKDDGTKKTEPCVEDIAVQHAEFVPVNFDEGSAAFPQKSVSTTKTDVDPVKAAITAFVQGHPDIQITNIDITSSSSKTPFYKQLGTKKVFDRTYSDDKNRKLAQSRADVAQRILEAMKSEYAGLGNAKYTTTGAINGPDFNQDDLKLREVKPGSKDYKVLVENLFVENQKSLKKEAMVDSADKLLEAKNYKNLYEAKYKPYQGFKVVISGFLKAKRKCGDKDKATDVKIPVKIDMNKSVPGKSQN